MAEIFWNHNEHINWIDVKGDKVPDGFNENQIKDKAKQYVENRIKEWISQKDYDKLLKEIRQLLERQDVERFDLIKELKQKEIWEIKEDVDKEALIQESKTMIYEILWINEKQEKNSKLENFLKWAVDELVIWNYELAIDIWNSNGKVIIDSLKQLASWEWIKKVAESLWETVWNLFDGNAYEKWKSAAQLWFLTTAAWLWFAVWRKWVRAGIKEVTKLRPHKENIVTSPEVKWAVKDTSKKVEEIVPKQEVKTAETSKRIDQERQIKWLEQLWLPESFSRDMLESWLMNEKFLWGDLLRRFEDLHKKWIDYNKMIDKAIEHTPSLTRKEALLIFSYTDEVIYRKLNAFMRWDKEVLASLTPQNIEATRRIIQQMEHALEKMPNLKPWEDWFILRWDKSKYWNWKIWDEIELDSFTSVSNNRQDIFLWEPFNNDAQVSIIWKEWRIKDISKLSIAVNFWVSKEELKTLTDFSGKLKKLPRTNNEWVILPNSRAVITDKFKLDDINYINAKQTK